MKIKLSKFNKILAEIDMIMTGFLMLTVLALIASGKKVEIINHWDFCFLIFIFIEIYFIRRWSE